MSKIKQEDVNQVKIDMITTEAWLRNRTKVKESKCQNCSTKWVDVEGEVALVTRHRKPNVTVCRKCAQKFITGGAIDVNKAQKSRYEIKEELILEILELNPGAKRTGNYFSSMDLDSKDIESLTKQVTVLRAKRDKQLAIEEAIKRDFVETPTEQYLINEYQVFESEYLKHELQLEDYPFTDIDGLFDCGQVYATYEEELLVKIGNRFYDVTITVEVNSSKQDIGDRLYWVEGIESVTWERTEKPKPKEREYFSITGKYTKDQIEQIDNLLNSFK